jgi:hypothetical protein
MKPTRSSNRRAWSMLRSRTWNNTPPKPLTISRVVVTSPMLSSSVRSSAAKVRDAVVIDGTPSTTMPSASNRPRSRPAYTSSSLVSRIAAGSCGDQPWPAWSTRTLLKPATCHQRASRTEVSTTSR